MTWNRITRRGGTRRALGGMVLLAALAGAVCLAGCGGGGGGAGPAVDKGADAETLNRVLAREQAAIGAYDRVLPLLRGADLALASRLRAQEQEHVDAILKALRGLGAEAEPAEEEIEREGLKSRGDVLDFLYEIESVSVEAGLRAVSHLTSSWPRVLLGSIVANQAQHLVLLRRALGASAAASVPEAFENGTAPPPGPGKG